VMKEVYTTGGDTSLECEATYTNVRRFGVTTETVIPKK
jgi:hypothetical protein